MDHGSSRNVAMLVALVQAFVLAILLNKIVEKPVTRWLRRRHPVSKSARESRRPDEGQPSASTAVQ
jgi:peptidoglycan/LPS O-acetylase OafA/YrhL